MASRCSDDCHMRGGDFSVGRLERSVAFQKGIESWVKVGPVAGRALSLAGPTFDRNCKSSVPNAWLIVGRYGARLKDYVLTFEIASTYHVTPDESLRQERGTWNFTTSLWRLLSALSRE